MSQLRIGTCSWKYPSWHGLVYSAAKGINYLSEYAKRYNTVEVDQWFWSLFGAEKIKLPNQKDATEYRRSVNKDFLFSIKVPNSITLTHYYKKLKRDPLIPNPHFLSVPLWRDFITAIDPLKECLGPLILQFEYLNKDKMKRQSDFQAFLGRFLDEITPTDQVAVETRNPYYLNAGYFDFLKQHRANPVLLHGYWMPPVTDVYRKWKEKILTHEIVVVRLHGAHRTDIEKRTSNRWDQVVKPMDKELTEIAEMVKDLIEHEVTVFLNVNNHYEGSAPLTIERLARLLRSIGVPTRR